MNTELLDSMKKLIGTLETRKKALIDEFIIAKVIDAELAKILSTQINKIEQFLFKLSDAKTEDELKKIINDFKESLKS